MMPPLFISTITVGAMAVCNWYSENAEANAMVLLLTKIPLAELLEWSTVIMGLLTSALVSV